MPDCPTCGTKLERVPDSKWLNPDQYNSIKAGDWFCTVCPDNNRGHTCYCYWWAREIEVFQEQQINSIMRY